MAPTTQPCICVVDDDDAIRESLRALFEAEGYAVEEASNGQSALRLLCTSPRRMVVLLDQVMPVLDGVGLLNRIAENRRLAARHAYVLMSAEPGVLCRALTALRQPVPVPVLFKPFDAEAVLGLVGCLVRRLG